MKKISFVIAVLLLLEFPSFSWSQTPANNNQSLTYQECIDAYKKMDNASKYAKLIEVGTTDVGKPLHLFVVNKKENFDIAHFDASKTILLINNGIHPGEPCGIDASVRFADSLLNNPNYNNLLENSIVCIIPVYNIGGALNRGCCSRANQNGPEEYGFRGNAKNLDLNRDFIKMDSKNAASFTQLFNQINPHFFIDTHTSDGADYQYTMTMINTQTDKLDKGLGTYFETKVIPKLYQNMEDKNWGMVPYVHMLGKTPETGIKDYLDTPRYSTGYTALFNTLGFTSETHMFKPFADRVESTFQFEKSVLEYMSKNNAEIIQYKKQADLAVKQQKNFVLAWALDSNNCKTIEFKGYQDEYKTSEISGEKVLHYNREKPITFSTKYYNHYVPTIETTAPKYYIIPQGWTKIIERLKLNHVKMNPIKHDTLLTVQAFHVLKFETVKSPYEGHYLHYNPEIKITKENIQFYQGDLMVPVNQIKNKYIVEILEPQGSDSFFSWNFFDSCLQQKEWFSDYIFEDIAKKILEDNPSLNTDFERKKRNDPEFISSHWNQLYWIYKHSGYYESTVNRLPVFRYNP